MLEFDLRGLFELRARLAEDDPTHFATMAENLPEPPSFDDMPVLDPVEFAAQIEYEAAIAEPVAADEVVVDEAPAEVEPTAETETAWGEAEPVTTDEPVASEAEAVTETETETENQFGEADTEAPVANAIAASPRNRSGMSLRGCFGPCTCLLL